MSTIDSAFQGGTFFSLRARTLSLGATDKPQITVRLHPFHRLLVSGS
jgi:hypothetical protein